MSKKKKYPQVDNSDINKQCHPECAITEYICPKTSEVDDEPLKIPSLGIRIGISILGWVLLGFNPSEGSGFFTSLMLFALPLLVDYIKFKPTTNFRNFVRFSGIVISFIWIIFSFIGLSGLITVKLLDNEAYIYVSNSFITLKGVNFKLIHIWRILGVSPALTLIDFFVFKTKFEKAFIKGLPIN